MALRKPTRTVRVDMCRPLTVSCLRRTAGVDISDHCLTMPELEIPCTSPGSSECRDRTARLVDFQVPPTTCAGYAAGLVPGTEECEQCCLESLSKYGEALYHVNMIGSGKSWQMQNWIQRLVSPGREDKLIPFGADSEKYEGF